MGKLTLLVLVQFILSSLAAWAEVESKVQIQQAHFATEAERSLFSIYTTGKEFCEKYREVISKENGFRVKVPVDYQDPSKGETEIFAFWAESFYDPQLPTFIFFDGGSGGNSHRRPRLTKNFNQLHFDQRGIGCSRPDRLTLYRDPNFYSSINNVYDANRIREHLGISKISVYGGSYGTMPATMFASLLPEYTQSAVLEGVLYSQETSENSQWINFYLRKMYATFSDETKAAMKSYFNTWDRSYTIDVLARMSMYEPLGFERLRETLLKIFPNTKEINTKEADRVFSASLITSSFFEGESLNTVDAVNNLILRCKERRTNSQQISLFIHLPPQDLEFYLHTQKGDIQCDDLKIAPDAKQYSADQYPISVPTSYFQGTWDGATFPKEAVLHYKNVPKAAAQIFLVKKAGHSPNASILASREQSTLKDYQLQITEKALRGEMASKEEVLLINKIQQAVQWTHTKK